MKHSAEKVTTNATFTFRVFGFVGVYTKTRIQIPNDLHTSIYPGSFSNGSVKKWDQFNQEFNNRNNKFWTCSIFFGIFLCPSPYLDMKFSHATLFEGHKHDFSFSFQTFGRFPRTQLQGNSPSFAILCEVQYTRKSLKEQTREFILIVTFTLPSRQSLLKRPMLMNELPLVLPQTRMIAGGKLSWLVGRNVYSTKHFGFKRNRIKSTHVRFRIQNHLRLDQIETFIFRIHASACKWKNQSGTKIFRNFSDASWIRKNNH